MKERILQINDISVDENPMIYICYGLGSCIGLFITDRIRKISAGAHIPLPNTIQSSAFKSAPYMIDEMLQQLKVLGSNLNNLRAKFTGGAQIYNLKDNLGAHNINSVFKELVYRKIYIASTDVGGHYMRRAHFNSANGELQIQTSEEKKYCI